MITQTTVMLTAYTKLPKHIFLSLSLFVLRPNIYWHMDRNFITDLYNFRKVTLNEQIRWNDFILISMNVDMDDRSIIIIQSFYDNELNPKIFLKVLMLKF